MNYWVKRAELAPKAKEHTKLMQEKYSDEIAQCISQSVIYGKEAKKPVATFMDKVAEQILLKDTTVGALFKVPALYEKVALLNFASYNNAGGKFIEGSSAQEESLCHSSFLYNVLSGMPEFYEWNNAHKNKALYMDRAIYSPNVVFIDGDEVRKADVITCAAPNRSVLEKYGSFTEEENFDALSNRIYFVRDICMDNHVDVAILGAWGCGVFRQEPSIVANLLKETFAPTGIKVIYAVPDEKTYSAFQVVIGKN